MSTSKKNAKQDAESRARRQRLLELLEQEVREQSGEGSTLEERNDAAVDVVKDALWRREDEDLRWAVTTAAEVEVDEKRFSRLQQAAPAPEEARGVEATPQSRGGPRRRGRAG